MSQEKTTVLLTVLKNYFSISSSRQFSKFRVGVIVRVGIFCLFAKTNGMVRDLTEAHTFYLDSFPYPILAMPQKKTRPVKGEKKGGGKKKKDEVAAVSKELEGATIDDGMLSNRCPFPLHLAAFYI
jgi:hypothetical protein